MIFLLTAAGGKNLLPCVTSCSDTARSILYFGSSQQEILLFSHAEKMDEQGNMYSVVLDKMARGRGLSVYFSTWATRNVVVRKQLLEYYNGTEIKGLFSLKGAVITLVLPQDAGGHSHPFLIENGDDKIMFSAPSAIIRDRTVEIFRRAAEKPDWLTPEQELEQKRVQELEEQLAKETADQHILPPGFSSLPPGAIIAFAGSTAPPGWLLCDGSLLDLQVRPECTVLAAILSGGERSGVRLPNLRGHIIVAEGDTLGGRQLEQSQPTNGTSEELWYIIKI